MAEKLYINSAKKTKQNKKPYEGKQKTWLRVTETRFNMNTSRPTTLFPSLLEAFPSPCVWGHKVAVGSALQAELHKAERGLVRLPSPAHHMVFSNQAEPA